MKNDEKALRAIKWELRRLEPQLKQMLISHIVDTTNGVPITSSIPLMERLRKLQCPFCYKFHRNRACTAAQKLFEAKMNHL